jgi:hypothetical protein
MAGLGAKRTSWSASEDSVSTAAETDDDGLELTLQPSSEADVHLPDAVSTLPTSTLTRPTSHRNLLSPALEVPTPTGSTGHSRTNSSDTFPTATSDDAADALQSMSLNIMLTDTASPTFLRRARRGSSQVDVNARFVPSRDSMYLDDVDVAAMLAKEDEAVKAEQRAEAGLKEEEREIERD